MPEVTTLTCPYCGEPTDVHVEASTGFGSYIEDCTVCCRPIELVVHVEESGAVEVEARRGDD